MSRASKKILLVSPQPFFQWRGSPIRVAFDAQALAESGFEVDLLTLPIGEKKIVPGVRVVRVPNIFMRRSMDIGPSAWKALFDCLLLAWAACMSLGRRYAVIHGIEDAGPIALAAARLSGAKFVFEKHSDPISYSKPGARRLLMNAYAAVERFVIRRADAVIGTGPGLVEQAKAAGGRGPVHHIPDIPSSLAEASPESTAAARARMERRAGELLAVYVGSFAVYQGMDLLFDSMPVVLRRNPAARFVIIGGSDAEIAERKARLAGMSLEERATFLGKIPPDELPAYLAAADVLLSPRISGVNTPLKLLDYLKAGRAVVATDNLSNRHILDESTAVLAAPDPASFAEGILRLLADASLRQRMGARGRALFAERYNYGEFKRLLCACYLAL